MRAKNTKAEVNDKSAKGQNEKPTPLELATLSTQLVIAGLLPRKASIDAVGQKETIQAALKFIDLCKTVEREAAERRAKIAKARELVPVIQKMCKEHAGKPIPLNAIIRTAGASRTEPTPEELAELNESRDWKKLSESEKNRLRFERYAPAMNKDAAESEARARAIIEGFSHQAAWSYVELIVSNLKGRTAHQRQEAANAPKKKRTPQRRDENKRFAKPTRKTGHDNAGQYDRQQ